MKLLKKPYDFMSLLSTPLRLGSDLLHLIDLISKLLPIIQILVDLYDRFIGNRPNK
ncbi:hypothetical protein [Vibrio coralliilyticus]|uniref:hypothetical protein n=1 Tax=Vibrio coralliilyticus TaxID=190893 RepID=UPI001E31F947|nr:hypothetical protein [Vibrio coralliilyticus]MCC2521058.1 hypothetical protein [Vibrio coralliilyticus]